MSNVTKLGNRATERAKRSRAMHDERVAAAATPEAKAAALYDHLRALLTHADPATGWEIVNDATAALQGVLDDGHRKTVERRRRGWAA